MDQFRVIGDGSHVFRDIFHERMHQDSKWGLQNHHPILWHLILAEEFGELGRALNEWHFRGADIKSAREELVQTAAVCVAMLESMDRNMEKYK